MKDLGTRKYLKHVKEKEKKQRNWVAKEMFENKQFKPKVIQDKRLKDNVRKEIEEELIEHQDTMFEGE